MTHEAAARFRAGLIFGLVAYGWWGAMPLYFAELRDGGVPALEILAQRIFWALPVLMLLVSITGGWPDLRRVLGSRKLVLTLFISGILLAGNWLLYIVAAVSGRVTEASLGYYMMPLVNAALATLVLGERLRPAHYPALALVGIAVLIPCLATGTFPGLAVGLTISFGLYGLVRKQVAVESVTGLTVESLLLLPAAGGYLIFLTATGADHFGGSWAWRGLIAFSGLVTVVPLVTFTLSIRRLPLLMVSFLQFLSPTIQMLIAVLLQGETLSDAKVAAFCCVWGGVMIFFGDAIWQTRARWRRVHPESVSVEEVRKPTAVVVES